MIETTTTEKFEKLEVWNEIKELYTNEKQFIIKKIQTLLRIDMQKIEEKVNYENVIDGEMRIYGRIGDTLKVTLKIEIVENCLCSINLNLLLKIVKQSLKVVNTFIPSHNMTKPKDVELKQSEKDFTQLIEFNFYL